MAHTARSEADKVEHFDDGEVLDKKAYDFAQHLLSAKFPIAFTGAGISTCAGIADFRSGMNTKLETGPGCWELKAKGVPRPKNAKVRNEMLLCRPTYSHMALKELVDQGILRGVISQNVDGLHLRSGIPKNKLAELHGNTNLEKCTKCKREYLRDMRVRTSLGVHDHKTGRQCDVKECRGDLVDSIVNFGETLPSKEFKKADKWEDDSDLCLVLGSSLTVTPASDFAENIGKKSDGTLYIVNLQSTPLDKIATRINGITDDVMKLVMKHLKIEVPRWTLTRGCRVQKTRTGISIEGIEPSSGLPYQIFSQVRVGIVTSTKAPFVFSLPNGPKASASAMCSFVGRFDEPVCQVPLVAGEYRLTLHFEDTGPRWDVHPVSEEAIPLGGADGMRKKSVVSEDSGYVFGHFDENKVGEKE